MSAVVTAKDFEDRLFEKIRADIGSLMTDEQLKALVTSAMERTFFQERITVNSSGYGSSKAPPYINELVKGLLETKVKDAVSTWLKDNPDEVRKQVEKALEGGLSEAMFRSVKMMLDSTFAQMQHNLQEALQNALVRR